MRISQLDAYSSSRLCECHTVADV